MTRTIGFSARTLRIHLILSLLACLIATLGIALSVIVAVLWHDSHHVPRSWSNDPRSNDFWAFWTASTEHPVVQVSSMRGELMFAKNWNPAGYRPSAFSSKMKRIGPPQMPGPIDPRVGKYDLTWGCNYSFLGFAYDHETSPLVQTYLVVPYYAPFLVLLSLALLTGRLGLRGLIKAARRRQNRCVRCGYDLRATEDRCPECGTPVPLTSSRLREPAKGMSRILNSAALPQPTPATPSRTHQKTPPPAA